MQTLKIFRYIEQLDCFVVTHEYSQIADALGLTEWHPAVWIGRLFVLDNDYGEHWFDNWDLRERRSVQANALGLVESDLFIIDPSRFQNGQDGPCNTADIRKRFWTDVLKSLELSLDLIFDKARQWNQQAQASAMNTHIPDLEERIAHIKAHIHP